MHRGAGEEFPGLAFGGAGGDGFEGVDEGGAAVAVEEGVPAEGEDGVDFARLGVVAPVVECGEGVGEVAALAGALDAALHAGELFVGVFGGDGAGMDAVFDEDLGEIGELTDFGEAEIKVEVLGVADVGRVVADGADGIGTKHGGGVDDGGVAVEVEVIDGIMGVGRGEDARGAAGGVDEEDAAADANVRGVGLEEGELNGETVGEGEVVGIHAGDEGRAGEIDGEVEGGNNATGGGVLDVEARVGAGDAVEDLGGGVGGTVVDDDDFEIRKGLAEDAVEGAADVACAVAHGDEH